MSKYSYFEILKLMIKKIVLTDIEGSEKINGVPTTSFFVQDLLDGYIHYSQSDHLNKEPVFDEFLFIVTDGVNKSPMHHFRINILVRLYIQKVNLFN